MNCKICLLILTIVMLLVLTMPLHGQVKVTIDRNSVAGESGNFKFKSLPSPANADVASKAKLSLIDGETDPNGGALSTLTDGLLPTDAEQSERNFFFNAGTSAGRLLMDLGSLIEVAQVNTYSWGPNTRAAQSYKLYASDSTDRNFNSQPKRGIDPITCGWKLIATVDTALPNDELGAQYGVSVSDTGGSLGKYRYLLFEVYPTERIDDYGNTFFSEIDVVGK